MPIAAAGPLERHFTEKDPRKWALWRISMVRQFQPAVLGQMSAEDLLYLAGQSPAGCVGEEAYGTQLDRNKVTQNADCDQFGCCRPRLSDEADGGLVVQKLMHVNPGRLPVSGARPGPWARRGLW
jgi:hypothetical protein